MIEARKLAIRPSLKWVQGMSKEDEDEWKQLVERYLLYGTDGSEESWR